MPGLNTEAHGWSRSIGPERWRLVSIAIDDFERGATSTQHYVTIGARSTG